MVEEATEERKEPRKDSFYPGKDDAYSALPIGFSSCSNALHPCLSPLFHSHITIDGREALGCSPSLFLAHYPQLYPGFAKNGCPLFISKPGLIDIDAIECITSVDGILKFHWHVMCHDFAGRLKKAKEADKNFTR